MFVANRRWIEVASDATVRAMRDGRCVRNACVEAACIAVGVAERFGYLCEPIPVAVQIVAGREATVLPGDGSRRRPGFAGHLIVFYPGADLAVDLTSGQFHAPERGLVVPDMLLLERERSTFDPGFEFTLPGGVVMSYRELVGDVSWRSLPAWRESSELVVANVVRRIRGVLDAPVTASQRRHRARTGTFRT